LISSSETVDARDLRLDIVLVLEREREIMRRRRRPAGIPEAKRPPVTEKDDREQHRRRAS
jgi:hypothetical protein